VKQVNDASDDQPYAPPTHAGDAVAPTELKKTPVLVVLLFTVITLGLYFPIWFLRRRKALNHLAPEDDNVNVVVFGLAGLFVLAFCFGLYQGLQSGMGAIPTRNAQLTTRIVDLVSRLFVIVASFRVKTILEGHYPERLSAVWTFFLSIFYLQYRINRAGQTDPAAEQFTLR
jgi:hypothetical protein